VLPALFMHGSLVLFLMFTPFMAGFLFTVFLRWPAPEARLASPQWRGPARTSGMSHDSVKEAGRNYPAFHSANGYECHPMCIAAETGRED